LNKPVKPATPPAAIARFGDTVEVLP